MKRPFALLIGMAAGVLACSGALAASTPQSFALPGHGTLLFNVPAGWQTNEKQLQGGPPTIQFGPRSGAAFAVLITAVWGTTRAGAPDDAGIRSAVTSAAKDAEPRSVEGSLSLQDFSGSTGHGYYFRATDKAPPPGEWKYLTQGMVRTGAIALTFSILTNDGGEATEKAALEMIRLAVVRPLDSV
jgi:hypothetical protein